MVVFILKASKPLNKTDKFSGLVELLVQEKADLSKSWRQ